MVSVEGSTPYDRPPDPVVALVRLGTKGFPLLIDCLEDGRLTIIEFDGNTITEAMKVPVGYVCLDILMGTTRGRPTSDPDCADDGLGACMNDGYYFRPDDYYHCVEPAHSCDVRPSFNGTGSNGFFRDGCTFTIPMTI